MQPCTEGIKRITVIQKKLTFLTAERMQSPVSCVLQTVLLSVFPDSFINCRAGVPWDMQFPSKFSNQTKPHCPAQLACHLNQLSCWIWKLFVTQTHIHQWLKHITATTEWIVFNPLNAELNPICYLLALLAHHFLHISRIRVKSLNLRLLMSYIYIWSTHSWCF